MLSIAPGTYPAMSFRNPSTIMDDIAASIAATLEARRRQLPRIEVEIGRWRRCDELVFSLQRAIDDLRRHPATPADVGDVLASVQVAEVGQSIAEAVDLLRAVCSRVGRSTVNIGVSGQARVGKSTLLQSISGLGEEHVPTGSGIPVTAVRSRIFHSPARHRAVIELHSFETFRTEVLDAYHRVLGLRPAPRTVEEFRSWSYPGPGELVEQGDVPHEHQTILRRLRDMQSALWSYAPLLSGPERTIELAGDQFGELRSFVAYPTNAEQESGQPVARRYLAVRDIRIECPFPYAGVGNLGIIDLPGLGELAADAEEHHVAGLRNDVDLVLLVKRAVEGMSFWGERDSNAVKVIDRARGSLVQRRDFAFVVLNTGATTPNLAASLRDDVRRNANDGRDGLNFHVLDTDARDQGSVFADVLRPVLRHLAERLPAMDNDVIVGVRRECEARRSRVAGLADDVSAALSVVRSLTKGVEEDLQRRTTDLRVAVAKPLQSYVDELRERSTESDEGFLEELAHVHRGILEWIGSGFGIGREKWCENAENAAALERSSLPYTIDQMNEIRVEISSRFSALNSFFDSQVRQMRDRVGEILADNLGELVTAATTGEARLEALSAILGEATEPCDTLRLAIDQLLSVRIDYRAQLHPLVRPGLDGLDPRCRDSGVDGPGEAIHEFSPGRDGAEELFDYMSELAEQAAYRTRKALARQAVVPAQVLFAAVEEFEDRLIRSADSKWEFGRLARSYRDDIWPGVYEGLYEANAHVHRVVLAAKDVATAAAGLGEI